MMTGSRISFHESLSDVDRALAMMIRLKLYQASLDRADLDRKILDIIKSLIYAKEHLIDAQEALNADEQDSSAPVDCSGLEVRSPGKLANISLTDEELKMLLSK